MSSTDTESQATPLDLDSKFESASLSFSQFHLAMSLYHETAAIVIGPASHGGSLKSRIYGSKDLKSPPAQVYALAFESSKWSAVLKEVIENSQLLQKERKVG